VLLGDEGGAEIEDHAFDLRQEILARGVVVVAAGNLELDLADRSGVDPFVLEELEQPVPIWNPCCLDLNRRPGHPASCFRIRNPVYPVDRAEKPPVLDPRRLK